MGRRRLYIGRWIRLGWCTKFQIFLDVVEGRFFRGFLRKRVVPGWFFVVKLWWIAGKSVVF
jgi:hypothetical protein